MKKSKFFGFAIFFTICIFTLIATNSTTFASEELNAVFRANIALQSLKPVQLYAFVIENRIHVDCWYRGGRKVVGGIVEVYDNHPKGILSGRTNKNGEFDFIPRGIQGKISIYLTTPDGLKNNYTIPVDVLARNLPSCLDPDQGTDSRPIDEETQKYLNWKSNYPH
jgi:hypothetical protein